MKSIFCFAHGGHASEQGAVTVATEFGARHFCAKCSHLAKAFPVYVPPPPAPRAEPVEAPQRPQAKQPKPTVSMASWVRAQRDAGSSVDEIIAMLPAAYPDSKPGINPKLAKGYVNCYLK